MEAEDSAAAGRADQVRTAGPNEDAGAAVDQARDAEARAGAATSASEQPTAASASDADLDADVAAHAADETTDPSGDATTGAGDDAQPAAELDPEAELAAEPTVRGGRPVTSGIGCAALLLPLIAVVGAVLCFAAGLLSTVTGCTPNGSALCSANGAWFTFALPLFVSPIIAAATAIGAVTVRRHRSSWLAVGYGVVFISVIVGLASASTGSS